MWHQKRQRQPSAASTGACSGNKGYPEFSLKSDWWHRVRPLPRYQHSDPFQVQNCPWILKHVCSALCLSFLSDRASYLLPSCLPGCLVALPAGSKALFGIRSTNAQKFRAWLRRKGVRCVWNNLRPVSMFCFSITSQQRRLSCLWGCTSATSPHCWEPWSKGWSSAQLLGVKWQHSEKKGHRKPRAKGQTSHQARCTWAGVTRCSGQGQGGWCSALHRVAMQPSLAGALPDATSCFSPCCKDRDRGLLKINLLHTQDLQQKAVFSHFWKPGLLGGCQKRANGNTVGILCPYFTDHVP